MNTPADRAEYLRQVNANHAIEELVPDQADVALQVAFVFGKATVADMLTAALDFAQRHKAGAT